MTSAVLLLVELVLLFVGVSFLIEILQRRFGPERLRRWMGGHPVAAALKGIVIGFVTPFCTYSAIPLLVGMRRAGVPAAGYVAFISAAPVLDPILFGALWLIVGPSVALLYFVVTFVAALALALTAHHVGIERHLKPMTDRRRTLEPVVVGAPGATRAADELAAKQCTENHAAWQGWGTEARSALASSRALLRSFGPLLLLGVAIGIAIETVVPPEAAARLTSGSPWFAIPTASALGTPLYFSTELFVPIANSLHTAGVGVGAIVSLTIAGAGANVPEFIVLSKMAARSVMATFFGYVFAVAMVGGLLAHMISGSAVPT